MFVVVVRVTGIYPLMWHSWCDCHGRVLYFMPELYSYDQIRDLHISADLFLQVIFHTISSQIPYHRLCRTEQRRFHGIGTWDRQGNHRNVTCGGDLSRFGEWDFE